MDLLTDNPGTVGVIVAHPDDETLWAGGTLLLHPRWQCMVFALCRASDAERAARFYRVLEAFGATGEMADLDDGPAQDPLPDQQVAQTILALVNGRQFDLLFTHGPMGEYTYHLRHVETSRVVQRLWAGGELTAGQLCLFAYEDGGRAYYPRPRADAGVTIPLPPAILQEKTRIIRDIYGFAPDSWEAQAIPVTEAFQCIFSSGAKMKSALTPTPLPDYFGAGPILGEGL